MKHIILIFLFAFSSSLFAQNETKTNKGLWSIAVGGGAGKYSSWKETKGIYDRPFPYSISLCARYKDPIIPIYAEFGLDLNHYSGYTGNASNGYNYGRISARIFDVTGAYNFLRNSEHFSLCLHAGLGVSVVSSLKTSEIKSSQGTTIYEETFEGRMLHFPIAVSLERTLVGNLNFGIFWKHRILSGQPWMESGNTSCRFTNGGAYFRWNFSN